MLSEGALTDSWVLDLGVSSLDVTKQWSRVPLAVIPLDSRVDAEYFD